MKTFRTLLTVIALSGISFAGHPTTTTSIAGTPVCTGFGPTNGQVISFTTGASPNPCFTSTTISGSGAGTTTNTVTFQTSGGAAAGTTFNGSSPVTIDFSTIGAVPTTRTVNGHALSGNVTVTTTDLSLNNLTNDLQTKAAIVPNTVPAAGQALLGNAGGTAYAPVTLSGPVSVTSAGVTSVATLNQNTTGSAAKWTTARTLAGNSVDGSANVAFPNKFIVQGTVDAGLSGAQFLGALGTGLVKNTTTTGVLSIATPGTDYVTPAGVPITEIDNATVAVTPSSGKVNFAPGTNVTLTTTGNTLTITASTTAATAFSALTGSTNTGQAFMVGAGSSLAPTGGGTITATTAASATTASQINGGTVPVSAPLLGTNGSSQPVSVTTLPASVQPVHTGDVTNIGGSLAMTVKGINGTLLSSLATGIVKNTTGTGVPAIAVAGTDYLLPGGNGSALTGITASQVGAPTKIASAISSLNTAAIAGNGGCNTTTIAAAGVVATDRVEWSTSGSIKAVTGYVPSVSGGLGIYPAYAGAGTVNFDVCNFTSASITPGAVSVIWGVIR